MLIAAQSPDNRRAQRTHPRSQKDIADEAAGAGAEEGIAGLVGITAGSAGGAGAAATVGVAMMMFMGTGRRGGGGVVGLGGLELALGWGVIVLVGLWRWVIGC